MGEKKKEKEKDCFQYGAIARLSVYFTFSSRLKRTKEWNSPLRMSKQMHANEGVEGGVRGERRKGRAGG